MLPEPRSVGGGVRPVGIGRVLSSPCSGVCVSPSPSPGPTPPDEIPFPNADPDGGADEDEDEDGKRAFDNLRGVVLEPLAGCLL